jgi:hypothetical protein
LAEGGGSEQVATLVGLNCVLTRFAGNILDKQCCQIGGRVVKLKQCCHTFFLKKRFWDAACFTHMPVDFK